MQRGFALRLAGLCAGLLVAIAWPGASALAGSGQTVDVFSGPHAIRQAVNQASPGDTLRIHPGRYHEHFTINKSLRLVAAGDRRPVIDAGCGARATIRVRHAGVVLKGLKVVGADQGFGQFPSEVDFNGVASGRAEDLVVHDTCDAEYGINVFNSGPLAVVGNRGSGFRDSAIYIGGILDTGSGALRVRGNDAFANNRGIIVEDSDATQANVDVRVIANTMHDNNIPPGEGEPSGLFLHNSDGIAVDGNRASSNADFGIHLDPGSDSNILDGNVAHNNGTQNYKDEGAGNCGSGNSFAVVPC